MKRFEYEITLHSVKDFERVAVFCSREGTCNVEAVPEDHITKMTELLNRRGEDGWELVQLSFGQNGLMAIWKQEIFNE